MNLCLVVTVCFKSHLSCSTIHTKSENETIFESSENKKKKKPKQSYLGVKDTFS